MHVIKKHVNVKSKDKVEIEIVADTSDVINFEDKFICHICHRQFEKDINLTKHLKRHESDYQCKDCGKRCTTLLSLRTHMMIHENVYPYKCEFCGKPFRNAVKLKLHTRIHTGEKPYECDMCEMKFARLERLKSHKYDHVKSLIILPLKEKYNEIKAKSPYPVLPPVAEMAQQILAESNKENTTKIELKYVEKVKDDSEDEDEEYDFDDEYEEIVEIDITNTKQHLSEEIAEESANNEYKNEEVYEVIVDANELIMDDEIELEEYILEDSELNDEENEVVVMHSK